MCGVEPWPLADPNGLRAPRLKVWQERNFDFRSHHAACERCIDELGALSKFNVHQVPVVVTMNLTPGSHGIPAMVVGPRIDATLLHALDDLIATRLQGHLVTPGLVRGVDDTLQRGARPRLAAERRRGVALLVPSRPGWRDAAALPLGLPGAARCGVPHERRPWAADSGIPADERRARRRGPHLRLRRAGLNGANESGR